MAAALFSAASHAQTQVNPTNEHMPVRISVDNQNWWNKFSPDEQEIVERIENEAARVHQETGEWISEKDSSIVMKKLDIDKNYTKLVNSLIKGYENNYFNDFYAADSKQFSPRKQGLKQKALTEIFDYTFDTGKLLRYSDKNLDKLAAKIGAKEEEKPFLKYFLKQYLNINKNQATDTFYETEIVSDMD